MSDPKGLTVSPEPATLIISGTVPSVALPELPPEVTFLAQHKEHTERGAALILVAQLDEAIADSIKSKLIDDTEVKDRMFKEMQPLGSRVRMAYLMGLCDKRTYKDLIRIIEDKE